MDLQGRSTVIYLDHPWRVPLPQGTQSKLQNFRKGEPVILGVSQIMIGLMNICLWSMLKVYILSHLDILLSDDVFVYLLFFGPIFYIMSGTLSIVAGKKMTKNMICGSIGMNAVSVIFAGVSLIILALGLVDVIWRSETLVRNLTFGVVTVKLILTGLELFIALSLSSFGCHAVCCDVTSVVVHLSSNDLELSRLSPYSDYDEVAFSSTYMA